MRDYQAIVAASNRGLQLLQEQQIDVVVLTTNRGLGAWSLARLADHLDRSPHWARVSVSRSGVVWVRRTPRHEPVWKPRVGRVSKVSFATLERWGQEDQILSPPTLADDVGKPTP
jgi:hypothetical protein